MQFRFYLDEFASRDLAESVAKDQNLMRAIYADQWDPVAKVWHEPERSTLQNIQLAVRDFLGLAPASPWKPPSGSDVQAFISDRVSVEQDPRKPYLARITFTTSKKEFGIYFLNLLNARINDFLRQKALARANAYIAYLSAKAQTVTVAEHRMAITQALGDQERYAMVANSGTPFAAEIFEHPWASNLPASPKPRSVFLTDLLLGFAIGMGISYVRRKYGLRQPFNAWLRKFPPLARSTTQF
jgi:hypothetical protein